jgi:hypothetical protein
MLLVCASNCADKVIRVIDIIDNTTKYTMSAINIEAFYKNKKLVKNIHFIEITIT